MAITTYSFPTRISIGSGAIALLPDALKELSVARPLIVTDRGLAPLAPVSSTRELLASAGLAPAGVRGGGGDPSKTQGAARGAAHQGPRARAVRGVGGGAPPPAG